MLNLLGSIVGADGFHCPILSRHPPGVHNWLRENGRRYVIFSARAFLPGKCSFSFSFKSTSVVLLRVFSFGAVCLVVLYECIYFVPNEVPVVCR